MTINGPATGQVAISGNSQSTVLEITVGASVDIVGLTIENGAATGSAGGGIVNLGTLTLTNSTITGNTAAQGQGGGIANSGTLTLVNSTVSDNTAPNGGGIANTGTMTVDNSAISDNTATANGGIYSSGTLTLTESILSGNTAFNGNGGVANYGGALTLVDSTVTGNTAAGAGGVGNYDNGSATISNSTITGNSAGIDAGIFNMATMTVIDSIVSSNVATQGNGGGIANGGDLMLVDSVVSGNSAQNDGGIVSTGDLILDGSTVSGNMALGQNSDLGNYGGTVLESAGAIVGNPTDPSTTSGATVTEPANSVSPVEPSDPIDRTRLTSMGIKGSADDFNTDITVSAVRTFHELNADAALLATPLLVEVGALAHGEFQTSGDWADAGLYDGATPAAGSIAFTGPRGIETADGMTPTDQTSEGGSLDGVLSIDHSTGHEVIDPNVNGRTANGLVHASRAAQVDASSGAVSFASANSGLVTGGHLARMSAPAEVTDLAAPAVAVELPVQSAQESRAEQEIRADAVGLLYQDTDMFTDWSAAEMAGFLLAPWLVIGIGPAEKRAAHLQALLKRGRKRFDDIPSEK